MTGLVPLDRRHASDRRHAPERRRLRRVELPSVPEEPPFLRPDRRTRVRRARRGVIGRALVVVQVVGGLLVALLLAWNGYSAVMASERLRVGRVDVRGGHFLSEGEVRELLGPAVGENILALDIEQLKVRLRASPWVADATVVRTLPDTLRVEIRERVPVALAEVDRLHLMDEDGTLIDLYGPRTAGFDLPIVRGLAGRRGDDRRQRAQRAGALLRDLGDLAGEVSEITVEPSGDLRVVLSGAGEVIRLADPPYRQRVQTFLALRRQLTERSPGAEYFDLRFRDRIYARLPPPPPEAAKPAPSPRDVTAPAAAAAPAVVTERR